MLNKRNIKSIELISNSSKGYISANTNLYTNLINSEITKKILRKATFGTPLIKLGVKNPKVMIIAGVHGNELPSQAAAIHLFNYLNEKDINGTVYIVPFASPESTMNNVRNFRNRDLNRSTMIKDSITYNILEKAKSLGVNALGDFHSTAINANPGREGVFSSNFPTSESSDIASFISESMLSNHFKFKEAGVHFRGALEDESNINGLPAVTCEVVSRNGIISGDSLKKSFLQMMSFLRYFKIV